ncbi:serine/threonine-protein kinase [Mycobacterium sp.]|uniref:serine/threonine-protein kinase n=1 Tax=Mycobacterium sp. TaxID=1785 RepID=UPI003A87A6FF
MPFASGDVFAGYVIERLLGTGGMGEVYLAQHPRLPRHDALKILSLPATDDAEFRARFNREAELAATLWHPHIVSVLDRGEFKGRLWISMEYVQGTDAGQLVRKQHPGGLPERDVAEIVAAVADALDFGHERRLLHRDVKPENILVADAEDDRRRVLLTDFGIARRIDDVSNLTEVNVAVGTISYVAPEQLLGKPLDGRADQYGLAATTFFLLTGAPPFQDSNRAVVVSHHLSTTPPRISQRRPELVHLDTVLAKALAKDPGQRYRSCVEFAEALGQRSAGRAGILDTGAPRAASEPGAGAGARPITQRLQRMVMQGRARGLTRRSVGGQDEVGILSFEVVPYDLPGNRRTPLPVEIQTDLLAGQLTEGDEVEVSGVWDGDILDADTVINFSAPEPAQRSSTPTRTPPGRDRLAKSAAPKRKRRRGVLLATAAAVLAVVVAAAAYFTDGFGIWAPTGPVVKPVSASVFSPDGAPDNPGDARLAIDGNPDTAWSTVTYHDANPFPKFIEGMGLMLHLSHPTALSSVSIDVSSTGSQVQIRAARSAHPGKLDDTTALTPVTSLRPGHNRLAVRERTETSDVLVWISALGATDGRNRMAISDITLRAAG